jgi:hypothetical protein
MGGLAGSKNGIPAEEKFSIMAGHETSSAHSAGYVIIWPLIKQLDKPPTCVGKRWCHNE